MRLLVRTWNVFHGNAQPPRRHGYLRRMVELASEDEPDVLCLQELPVWALPLIDDWSRMASFGAITRPPLWLGPISTWVTRLHQGLFRSGLAGQANVDSWLAEGEEIAFPETREYVDGVIEARDVYAHAYADELGLD